MSYRKTAHSVYDLKYHIVWITKYRKPILRGEIGKRVRELIRQTCASLDVYIIKGHVSKDHVHLLVSVPPNLAVSELVKRLKGRSSRLMLEEFGELRKTYWGRHLWPAVALSPMRSLPSTLKNKRNWLLKTVIKISVSRSFSRISFDLQSYRLSVDSRLLSHLGGLVCGSRPLSWQLCCVKATRMISPRGITGRSKFYTPCAMT